MNLKKVCILLAIMVNIGSAFSQRGLQNLPEYDYEPYHFGFLLGYNQMGFSMKQDLYAQKVYFNNTEFGGNTNETAALISAEPQSTSGFTIGIVGNMRINDHFDLRFIPALSFGERNLLYNYIKLTPTAKSDTLFDIKSIKSTLLEFPLNIKYKGKRMTNARPYLIGGLKYTIDLSSDEKKNSKNLADDLLPVKLKRYDIYGELGAGFDFYFDWFKMGIEAKMSYGLRDILVHDNSMFTSAISRLNSKIFQLSLTFE
jgi:hypothetical protein